MNTAMSDTDWAGVLSRWGNGVEDTNLQQRQASSSKTASTVTSREARHSSSMTSTRETRSGSMSTSMTSTREARTGSGVLGSLNREAGSGSEAMMETDKRPGWGQRSESQVRDRAERSAPASGGARSVSRPRWSYRGSESPGKENVEAGDR